MNQYYPHLYTPLMIGPHILRHRMAMPRCIPNSFTGSYSSIPLESMPAICGEFARQGAAIVTVPGPMWVNRHSRKVERPAGYVVDLDNEDYVPWPGDLPGFDFSIPTTRILYTRAAQAIHAHGSLAMISLMEIEPFGWDINTIPEAYLDDLCDDFARICKLYTTLGFDGGCFYMSYRMSLLAQSMSPELNRRTDKYGDVTALSRAVFGAVRRACGKAFLIEAQVSGSERDDGEDGPGYDIDGLVAYARQVEDLVDIFHIRSKDMHVAHPIGLNSVRNEPDTLRYARALKKAGIRSKIAPVGGYQDPELNEKILADGDADFFYMARAFLCDSRYEEKVRTGRREDITPCLRCNRCHARCWLDDAGCMVNPELILFANDAYQRAKDRPVTPKKVAVIGGGPAGMKAALTAAERGHQVTLFEASDRLGGQLLHADHLWFKWPLRDYRDYLIMQLEKSPVEVRLGTRAVPAQVKAEGFEAVILCTGGRAAVPHIDGMEQTKFWTPLAVFGHEAELGHRVVVVGGSETGVETALYLSHAGHNVTLLSRQRKLAKDAQPVHYIETLRDTWERDPNFHYHTNASTTQIGDGFVCFTQPDGRTERVACDDIVLCGGVESVRDDYFAYAELFEAGAVQLAGDAKTPGNVRKATLSAFLAASIRL